MNFELYPVSFYTSVLLLFIGVAVCVPGLRQGWGLPGMVVLATIGGWYIADALYNDYQQYFWEFGLETLNEAWMQVTLFILVFISVVKPIHSSFNRKFAGRESFTMRTYNEGILTHDELQQNIDRIFVLVALAWLGLMVIGLHNSNYDFGGLFTPYLVGYSINPWNRGRMGANFDALLSLASYAQIFVTASLGLIWAISKNPLTRFSAGLLFLLTVPMYILDRTRNKMLAILVPAAVAWVFLRIQSGWPLKVMLLSGMALVLNFWMLFVLANRSDTAIARAIHSDEAYEAASEAKHAGLNMFAELSYINRFVKEDLLQPTWGGRYWAELVNPIPRAIWAGKPTAGLEYAVLRGMDYGRSADGQGSGGVVASISTGIIGQGVVNFGRFFGPIAAALLMALWVALLARQDLLSDDNAVRFLLYGLGLILTFNMGRDITFLVVFPFVCGYAILLWSEKRHPLKRTESDAAPPSGAGPRGVGAKGSDRYNVDSLSSAATAVRELESRRTPMRALKWMPRSMKTALLAKENAQARQAAVSEGEPPTGDKDRPRQVAVPFRNYRRYRG